MEAIVRGTCKNAPAACANARNKTEIPVKVGESFTCPECGASLRPVVASSRRGISAGAVFAAFGILALAGGAIWFFLTSSSVEHPKNEQSHNRAEYGSESFAVGGFSEAENAAESGLLARDVKMYKRTIDSLRRELMVQREETDELRRAQRKALQTGQTEEARILSKKVAALESRLQEQQAVIRQYEDRLDQLRVQLATQREQHRSEMTAMDEKIAAEQAKRESAESQRDSASAENAALRERTLNIRASNFTLTGLDGAGAPLKEKHQRKTNKVKGLRLAFDLRANVQGRNVGALDGMRVEISGPDGKLVHKGPIAVHGSADAGATRVETSNIRTPNLKEGRYVVKVFAPNGSICGQQKYAFTHAGLGNIFD